MGIGIHVTIKVFISRLDCREKAEITLDPNTKFFKSYKAQSTTTVKDEAEVIVVEQHEDEMSSSDDHLFPLGSTEPSPNVQHSHLLPLDTFGPASLNDMDAQEQHNSCNNFLVADADICGNQIDDIDEMSSTDDIWISAAADETFNK